MLYYPCIVADDPSTTSYACPPTEAKLQQLSHTTIGSQMHNGIERVAAYILDQSTPQGCEKL